MSCSKGGSHNYELIDGVYICSKCSQVSAYKLAMSHGECLEAYQNLLEKCRELTEGEISLNDFKIYFEGLE